MTGAGMGWGWDKSRWGQLGMDVSFVGTVGDGTDVCPCASL